MRANELSHHGIKGQKWGVRNGPPYPLKMRRSGGYRGKMANTAKRKHLSTVTKDAKTLSFKYGFQLKKNQNSFDEDAQLSNPGFFKHRGDPAWDCNCTNTIIAFCARRRGLDVEAMPLSQKQARSGGESILNTCNRYFKGKFAKSDFNQLLFDLKSDLGKVPMNQIISNVKQETAKRIAQDYADAPDGAYGVANTFTAYDGHVFPWYKENGKIHFCDSQSGLSVNPTFHNMIVYGDEPRELYYTRLDDKELDGKKLHDAIKNSSDVLKHSASNVATSAYMGIRFVKISSIKFSKLVSIGYSQYLHSL